MRIPSRPSATAVMSLGVAILMLYACFSVTFKKWTVENTLQQYRNTAEEQSELIKSLMAINDQQLALANKLKRELNECRGLKFAGQ